MMVTLYNKIYLALRLRHSAKICSAITSQTSDTLGTFSEIGLNLPVRKEVLDGSN